MIDRVHKISVHELGDREVDLGLNALHGVQHVDSSKRRLYLAENNLGGVRVWLSNGRKYFFTVRVNTFVDGKVVHEDTDGWQ